MILLVDDFLVVFIIFNKLFFEFKVFINICDFILFKINDEIDNFKDVIIVEMNVLIISCCCCLSYKYIFLTFFFLFCYLVINRRIGLEFGYVIVVNCYSMGNYKIV